MPFSISKYARALPSLLDLKEKGAGPREFADQIVGTVSVDQLYLLQGRETLLTAAVASPVVGFNAFTTVVPANEVWYVWKYWVASVTAAGEAVTIQPSVLFDGVSSAPLAAQGAAPASSGIWVGSNEPFFATPGSAFGFLCAAVTLAPDVQGGLVITKLRV
jgi:hypothetical protein